MTYTVGSYVADRLSQIGLEDVLAVAGDFNLVLLDELLTEKLTQVYFQPAWNLSTKQERRGWLLYEASHRSPRLKG
jgi:hypothetical protein